MFVLEFHCAWCLVDILVDCPQGSLVDASDSTCTCEIDEHHTQCRWERRDEAFGVREGELARSPKSISGNQQQYLQISGAAPAPDSLQLVEPTSYHRLY